MTTQLKVLLLTVLCLIILLSVLGHAYKQPVPLQESDLVRMEGVKMKLLSLTPEKTVILELTNGAYAVVNPPFVAATRSDKGELNRSSTMSTPRYCKRLGSCKKNAHIKLFLIASVRTGSNDNSGAPIIISSDDAYAETADAFFRQ